VADEAVLSPTETPSTPLEDEDPTLVRAVWDKIAAGVSVQNCEAELPVDGYHVRRLVAHWMEEGALTLRDS
jgi:hypothetical protein